MILKVARLVARTQLTKGRLAFLIGIGAIAVLFGFGIGVSTGSSHTSDTLDMIDGFGIGVVAPVVGLILASAALGDFVDDRTLVYIWLRPVERWHISLGAALASVGTALPLVVAPLTLAAALGSNDATIVLGAAAAAFAATAGYAGVFLALGFKVRRALVWGIAYILIWEGFLARSVGFAAKLSVGVYSSSLLSHISGSEVPKHGSGPIASFVAPVLFAAIAIALTGRWLKTTEVA